MSFGHLRPENIKREEAVFPQLLSQLTFTLVIYLLNNLLTKSFVAIHQAGSMSSTHQTPLIAVPTAAQMPASPRQAPQVIGKPTQ